MLTPLRPRLLALVPAPLLLPAVLVGAGLPAPAPWQASWIWNPQSDVHGYNQTIVARKEVRLDAVRQAVIRITADSYYRLFINGRWVSDGPARNWPEHYQYDALDVTPALVPGRNEIRIVARYYGVGDFHRVPIQAGLLAQLDVTLDSGRRVVVGTDATWQTAIAAGWLANTPKVSIQMEPAEWYDARREDRLRWVRATVLFPALAGPWKDLSERDVRPMSRQPFAFRAFRGASLVRAEGRNFCLPAARLVNPGVLEANHAASLACGMATILQVDRARAVQVVSDGFVVAVDGRRVDAKPVELTPGRHVVLAFVRDLCSHQKEKSLRLVGADALGLENPLQPGHENPWCFIRFPEYAFATNDLRWISFRNEDPHIARIDADYARDTAALLDQVRDEATFRDRLGRRAEVLASPAMFVEDPTWQFPARRVVGDAAALVDYPGGLIHNNAAATVIRPSPDGDVELHYDLGEQNCGYYDLELVADAGVVVDINALEYIAPNGRLQHTGDNRNGLRYITKAGANRFISLKRRSGRHVFLTLRNLRTPVEIHRLQLIESTYPVQYLGSFSCSDARLDRIWDISTRTLKLCMEDTFTDCPLYEQTHWVGDARNEALLAFGVFGAEDLARRCIRITAESLDRYPIAGCQTPSGWDCLLPAWSFLWGVSTWDYYWQSGDREQLRAVFPAVIRNLKGAERFVDDRGLFTGPFWNMFDWSGADQGRKTVLHNSMFLVGAINAALREAEVLGDTQHTAWLQNLRQRVVTGINRCWDAAKQSYPDSLHDSGAPSPSTCQHTSFLSILYDIVTAENLAAARRNLLDPPEKMVRLGSPFAMLYLYETYEKLGLEDEIIKETYRHYLPMVESGATTVWESFPSGTTGSGGFPTRSHCHAWSSAPSRFLNRIILGVKTTAPGGSRVVISPRLNGLDWAKGTTATHAGPVVVSWKRTKDAVDIQFTVPAGVEAEFARNETLQGLAVTVNGRKLP